jgi:hypothetical protein
MVSLEPSITKGTGFVPQMSVIAKFGELSWQLSLFGLRGSRAGAASSLRVLKNLQPAGLSSNSKMHGCSYTC